MCWRLLVRASDVVRCCGNVTVVQTKGLLHVRGGCARPSRAPHFVRDRSDLCVTVLKMIEVFGLVPNTA